MLNRTNTHTAMPRTERSPSGEHTPEEILAAFFAVTKRKLVAFFALAFCALPLFRGALPSIAGVYVAGPASARADAVAALLFWPFKIPFRILDLFVANVGMTEIRVALFVGALLTLGFFYAVACAFVATDPQALLGARPRAEDLPVFVRQDIGDAPARARHARTRRR